MTTGNHQNRIQWTWFGILVKFQQIWWNFWNDHLARIPGLNCSGSESILKPLKIVAGDSFAFRSGLKSSFVSYKVILLSTLSSQCVSLCLFKRVKRSRRNCSFGKCSWKLGSSVEINLLRGWIIQNYIDVGNGCWRRFNFVILVTDLRCW